MTYLPVVKPEISGPIAHDLYDKMDEEYLKEQIEIIEQENPVIAEWIRKFSYRTDDVTGAAYCGMVVYKLLRSQAEVIALEEIIN